MKESCLYISNLKKLLSMPPGAAIRKILDFVFTKVYRKIDKAKVKTFGAEISHAKFEKSLNENVEDTVKSVREKQNLILPDRTEFQKIIGIEYPSIKRRVLMHAEDVCAHRLDVLGGGDIYFGDRIDWHCDFKTGYKWNPGVYYKDFVAPYGEGDIKLPWELSRFQHLTVLGQAYWITEDEKYALEFKNEILDWIKSNPLKCGVNWACTMDVAIRAANWLTAWEFFRKAKTIEDEFIKIYLKSILTHGRFIRNNLEYFEEITSNHYMSNITGLFFIACMVPEFKESEEWLDFSLKELESEMKKQVYPDGTDFEASTCYHRLVLELLFHSAILGKRRGVRFSEEFNLQLKKMFQAAIYLLKPNGMMPQIGDNDSGRFQKFEPPGVKVLDHRYLPALGAVYFEDPDLKVYDSDEIRAAVLSVFGGEGLEQFKKMKKRKIEDIKSHAFFDSGWFVIRDTDNYMIISCGQNGQNGFGGHAHNDKLSFELCLGGEDIFVDPGTYIYTADPDMRNLFRSTEYHNTVSLGSQEQNRWMKGNHGLFNLGNDSRPKVLEWETGDNRDIFIGEHYGYMKQGLIHRREIEFRKKTGKFVIKDRLTGNSTSSSTALFHLAPGLRSVLQGEDELMIGGVRVKFQNSSDIEISDYFYSPEYGVKEAAQVIRVFFNENLTTEIEKINE